MQNQQTLLRTDGSWSMGIMRGFGGPPSGPGAIGSSAGGVRRISTVNPPPPVMAPKNLSILTISTVSRSRKIQMEGWLFFDVFRPNEYNHLFFLFPRKKNTVVAAFDYNKDDSESRGVYPSMVQSPIVLFVFCGQKRRYGRSNNNISKKPKKIGWNSRSARVKGYPSYVVASC